MPLPKLLSRALALCLGASLLLASAAGADPRRTPGGNLFDPEKDRETHLISHAVGGGFPDGPSRNAAFSQDRQLATRLAFESDATNIVHGDANGVTDIFMVHRAPPYDLDGPPWRAARTELVSRGLGGQSANGPSYKPDLSGDQLHRPSCVAFVSAADNLVPGDSNGRPDAFVKWFKSGRIERVSVGSGGTQANGETFDVVVDGACGRVAFTSDASNLALTRARTRFQKPLVTAAPAAGTKQVYVRFIGKGTDNKGVTGTTFLASANRGKPGNASSYDVHIGRLGYGCPKQCGTTSGDTIAFASDATNLARGDGNGHTDVYKRSFRLPGLSWRRKGKPRYLKLDTKLVSATAAGRAGNGPSSKPAINDQGQWVAYETTASDLLAGDHNGVSDIVDTDTDGRRMKHLWVSRSRGTGDVPGNGGSHDPSITRPGSPVFFESDANNLQPNQINRDHPHDQNETRDVFYWNFVSYNVSLQSRNSNNEIPGLPDSALAVGADHHIAGSGNPSPSYYGNYLAFESSYPLLDLEIAGDHLPGLHRDLARAAALSHDDETLHQVYLRYIGPR